MCARPPIRRSRADQKALLGDREQLGTVNKRAECYFPVAFPLFPQESGEPAEGARSRPLPLRLAALPARRPAEGPDPERALRPLCPERPPLPALAPLLLLLRLLPRSRPAPHGAGLSRAHVPAQSQRGCARLPSPDAGAHLPQPQPGPAAAVAVAASISRPGGGGGAAQVPPFAAARTAPVA